MAQIVYAWEYLAGGVAKMNTMIIFKVFCHFLQLEISPFAVIGENYIQLTSLVKIWTSSKKLLKVMKELKISGSSSKKKTLTKYFVQAIGRELYGKFETVLEHVFFVNKIF